MKKLFSFLLALCMTISLAACGQQVIRRNFIHGRKRRIRQHPGRI